MSPSFRVRLTVVAALVLLVGCGSEEPPLDELQLRDALLSDPAVIVTLSEERRRRLAERLEEARAAEAGTEELRVEPDPDPERQVGAVDTLRRSSERDALVAATLSPGKGSLVVRGLGAAEERNATLPSLEGPRSLATEEEEGLALSGRAGRILAALMQRSGAQRLVRVTAWPAGATAVGDAIYVNGSWLVALAALEDRDGGTGLGTTRHALGRGDNPYQLYGTVQECVEDVNYRCERCLDGSRCDPSSSLRDFRTMREECEWLADDPSRTVMLCAAGFLSLDRISRCMRNAPDVCATGSVTNTVESIEQLVPFISRWECVQNLNLCIAGRYPTAVIGQDGGTVAPDGGTDPNVGTGSCSTSCVGGNCSVGSCGGCSGGSCGSCSGGSCGSCSGGSCGSCSGSGGSCGSCSGGSCGSCSGGGGGGGGGGGSCGSCSGGGGGGGGGGSCGGGSCGGGSCGGGSCGGGSCGGGCGGCQVAPVTWEQQAEAAVTYAFVAAPLLYLVVRRRRS